MKVLHVYNAPRSGGGSVIATRMTIAELRRRGTEVHEFMRDSSTIHASTISAVRTAFTALTGVSVVREFEKELERVQPNLVHINELFPLITPQILPICASSGVPVVMSVDDYHLTCPARNHFRAGDVCTDCLGGREWNAIRHNCKNSLPESIVAAAYNYRFRKKRHYADTVAHYITPSEFTRNWLYDQLAVPEASVSVIPLPVEIPNNPTDASAGDYIAFAGRVVPEKGVKLFLDSAERCRKIRDIPVRFARAEHFFQTVELPEWAEVHILPDRAALADFYRGARMLVVPSQWFETFGMVGAEAMSHGVPIIVSRLGAVAELVDEGVDGLAFEPGNARDLASKILELWDDPHRCQQMGEAARLKASTTWSLERHGEMMTSLYKRVIADSR